MCLLIKLKHRDVCREMGVPYLWSSPTICCHAAKRFIHPLYTSGIRTSVWEIWAPRISFSPCSKTQFWQRVLYSIYCKKSWDPWFYVAAAIRDQNNPRMSQCMLNIFHKPDSEFRYETSFGSVRIFLQNMAWRNAMRSRIDLVRFHAIMYIFCFYSIITTPKSLGSNSNTLTLSCATTEFFSTRQRETPKIAGNALFRSFTPFGNIMQFFPSLLAHNCSAAGKLNDFVTERARAGKKCNFRFEPELLFL